MLGGGSDPPSTKSVMLGGGWVGGVVDTNQRLQLQVKASSCSRTNAKHTKPTKFSLRLLARQWLHDRRLLRNYLFLKSPH